MVRGVAGQLHARLPYGCGIEMSDLIQAGNVGLLQAAGNFESANGAPLGGYARFRIRGEMLDMVRRHTRSCHSTRVSICETGEEGQTTPLASKESSPHFATASRQRAAVLREAMGRLPERHRAVVSLRYGRELTLREIGERLQVNESRACQLHQSALSRLRKVLASSGVREMAHL